MTVVLNTNDPLYAYNTPGYTAVNEGNSTTQYNTEGAQLTGLATMSNNAFLSEPESLSQFQARSMDPAVNSIASQTAATSGTSELFAAVEVLNPFYTQKVTIFAKYSTTSAVAGIGLYNFAGTLLTSVNSGALTASYAATVTSWTTPVVVTPGTYYVGIVTHSGSGVVDLQGTTLTVENALLAQATTFAANVLNWRFFSATVSANTLASPISGTIAGATNGWFVGLS